MAEGELFRDLMREEGDLAQLFETNRQTCANLLVHMYLTAESWARVKNIKLEDVAIAKQEITNESEYVFFQFEQSEESIAQNHGGLLGMDGLPIARSL